RALAALGLDPESAGNVEVVREGGSQPRDASPEPGPKARFDVRAGDEPLGELCVFAGAGRQITEGDRRTIALIAAELGVVAKSLVLVEETQRLAHTDPLTGLANRRAATERLEHEIERASRSGRPFCVALCDLDHFKRINDAHGHAVGDEVLRVTARELQGRTRNVDIVSRWGGEELLVVLTDADAAGGRIVGKRLRIAVTQACRGVLDGGVTMSVGVAVYERGIGLDALIDRADRALYRAKDRGRDALVVYGED
ncbi:MAG: GGDEF domain-containing protein, partial [Polyangiales bacterium]